MGLQETFVFCYLLSVGAAQFIIGKTPPAEFDMAELNGPYLPDDAVKVEATHAIVIDFY